MIGPFGEHDIAYMQVKAEKLEEFDVRINLKDKQNRRGEIHIYSSYHPDFDEYDVKEWDGAPYIVHVHIKTENGNSQVFYSDSIKEFLRPTAREWLIHFWELYKDEFNFEEHEEQMRWF